MNVKDIPGTKGFKASTTGVIFDKQYKVRKQYKDPDGYLRTSVLCDDGKYRSKRVHRLVLMAHRPIEDFESLTVNHKDLNVENNHIDNLEWITNKWNNVHAAVMREGYDKPTVIAKSPDGSYVLFKNLRVSSEETGLDKDLIWESIKNNREINGWLFEHHDRNGSLPPELWKPNFPKGRGLGPLKKRPVKALNWSTKEIKEYDSLHELASELKVHPSHIQPYISTSDKARLIKRNYIVVDQNSNFPELSDEIVEELKGPTGKKIVAYHPDYGVCFYPSASSFIKEHGLSKKAVTVTLKQDRLREIAGWWFCYITKPHLVQELKEVIQDVQVLI